MSAEIRKVAIIGSGVMGSQIAAQVANAGMPVLLLDIVPAGATDRNVLAKTALEKQASAFMHPSNAKLVSVGNLDDDFDKLKDVDWIVEAIVENLEIKSSLYKRVDAVRKPGSVVSSNTSTIPLELLIKGQSEAFAKDFLITHFFNPVRYMRLLELVTGPTTHPASIEMMRAFCDIHLGKGVVPCNDTPGFIANRLGMFFLQSAVDAALDLGLTVEEADEVCGRPMGLPRTGVFGLIDLVGIDLMPLIGKSLLSTLSPSDAYHTLYREPPLFTKMIADGYTGRKGKGGFYRFAKTETGKVKESINLTTGVYAPSVAADVPTIKAAGKSLRALCEAPDKIGQFAWRVLSETLTYAFLLVPATVPGVAEVDEAMRLGYNWKFGPFELLDQLDPEWVATRLQTENRPVPEFLKKAAGKTFYRVEGGKLESLALDGTYAPVKRPEGVLLLGDIKRAGQAIEQNPSASLWDIGDSVLCLEFHSKMNAIDADIFTMIDKARFLIGEGKGKWKGLVVHNDAENFSAGANLGVMRDLIKASAWSELEALLKKGQDAYHALRFAPFPSVAAPMGLVLGGGCEVTLHCSAVQAYAETFLGLVEPGVGLVPGWGGCTQMLGRAFDHPVRDGMVSPVVKVFQTISSATTTKAAAEALDFNLLRVTDGISMNKDRLLFDAKQRVLEMADHGYKAPKAWAIDMPCGPGRAALDLIIESGKQDSKAGPHDTTVQKALIDVLCGDENCVTGPTSEEKVMERERKAFLALAKTPETLARIEYMLEKGKPLKN